MTASRSKTRRFWWLLAVLIVVAAVAGYGAWYNLFRVVDEPLQDSPLEHFLYASIGTEGAEGTPYWLWMVLPRVFPEYLPGPGGWMSLGFSWEPGRELPMGITKKTIGFERIGLNCAFCHVSHVRLTADQGSPDFYPTGPSHQLRVQDYQSFLFRSAADPRFNADVLMSAIAQVVDLSLREKILYRFLLIPAAKRALLQQRDEFAWQGSRPRHGPGRVDPFNPVKLRIFEIPDDGTIGNADIPSIWNQDARQGTSIHWDGLARDLFEVEISSAIGDGARDQYLDIPSLREVQAFLMASEAPDYPLPVDQQLAAAGDELFSAHCQDCHGEGGSRTGTVIPIDELGTDRHRTDAWTQGEVEGWQEMAARYRKKYGAEWDFNFYKETGYVASLLDGIWLRGPYLHNGSVPSLRDLLEPPADRPAEFYRGYDLLDAERGGFVSDVAAAGGRQFFLYDTGQPGNGKEGHLWGTELAPEEKDALVEFLKTL